jgi:hypothetical protein
MVLGAMSCSCIVVLHHGTEPSVTVISGWNQKSAKGVKGKENGAFGGEQNKDMTGERFSQCRRLGGMLLLQREQKVTTSVQNIQLTHRLMRLLPSGSALICVMQNSVEFHTKES